MSETRDGQYKLYNPKSTRNRHGQTLTSSRGFTIVELLIVVVIIGILATIVIVAYNGITRKAQDSVLQSDLKDASTTLEIANATDGSYPSNGDGLKSSPGINLDYNYAALDGSYCLGASSAKTVDVYFITNDGFISSGVCPPPPVVMQTVTAANCSTTRTRGIDARDNHSYWIQKLADGKCWMLTNLAYVGGGNATYGDVKNIQNGINDAARVYVNPRYFIYPGANPAVAPYSPNVDTTADDVSNFGYLYNWCAAMGAQLTTSACANGLTPLPDVNVSVCPSGWRLPVGTATTGEFAVLNDTVNSGSTTTGAGLIDNWLGQRAGRWSGGFISPRVGYYWSSTQSSATNALYLNFTSASVIPSQSNIKGYGLAIRCIAA